MTAIILFTPEVFLPKVIMPAVAVGPVFRLIGYSLGFNGIVLSAGMRASLDTLGLGALLTYCSHHLGENRKLIRNLIQWNLWFIEPIPWALISSKKRVMKGNNRRLFIFRNRAAAMAIVSAKANYFPIKLNEGLSLSVP